MKWDYKKTKKCVVCGQPHTEFTKYGNPYEMCPICRRIAYNEAVKEAKEMNNEIERSSEEKRDLRNNLR